MAIKYLFKLFSKSKNEEKVNNEKFLIRVKRLILICDILIGKLEHKLGNVKENFYKAPIEKVEQQIMLSKSHLEGVYKDLEVLNQNNLGLIIEELKEALNPILPNKKETILIKDLMDIKKFDQDDKKRIINTRKEILDLIENLNDLKEKLENKK